MAVKTKDVLEAVPLSMQEAVARLASGPRGTVFARPAGLAGCGFSSDDGATLTATVDAPGVERERGMWSIAAWLGPWEVVTREALYEEIRHAMLSGRLPPSVEPVSVAPQPDGAVVTMPMPPNDPASLGVSAAVLESLARAGAAAVLRHREGIEIAEADVPAGRVTAYAVFAARAVRGEVFVLAGPLTATVAFDRAVSARFRELTGRDLPIP